MPAEFCSRDAEDVNNSQQKPDGSASHNCARPLRLHVGGLELLAAFRTSALRTHPTPPSPFAPSHGRMNLTLQHGAKNLASRRPAACKTARSRHPEADGADKQWGGLVSTSPEVKLTRKLRYFLFSSAKNPDL